MIYRSHCRLVSEGYKNFWDMSDMCYIPRYIEKVNTFLQYLSFILLNVCQSSVCHFCDIQIWTCIMPRNRCSILESQLRPALCVWKVYVKDSFLIRKTTFELVFREWWTKIKRKLIANDICLWIWAPWIGQK